MDQVKPKKIEFLELELAQKRSGSDPKKLMGPGPPEFQYIFSVYIFILE